MIMIPIPQDFRDYEAKFIGPLTFREAVCSLIAGLIEYGGVRFQSDILHLPVTSYIPPLIVAFIPLVLGFGEKAFHMKPETYFNMVVRNILFVPKHRPYKSKNYYDVHLTEHTEPAKKKPAKKLTDLDDDMIAYD